MGEQGAEAAWLIALHGDMNPEFQELAARYMREAVTEGEVESRRYAGLVDRAKRNRGKAQKFGTFYERVDGELQFYEIKDVDVVDKRRQAIGLPPLVCELCGNEVRSAVLVNGERRLNQPDCGNCEE
ncbi:hypothetical protein J2T60_002335 [Natronospira proteinivora]|uniref:Uncharacterized protein n=1 Tax=Natronospira proteinivora TaxID=1807133 RepID=A0ABT1GBM8_9GAMM|nr:DUF6624 domain-containing protein [Natronospira proteinivora]MCP1728335.1 hypothetical protein [Natronospira proteinivora]